MKNKLKTQLKELKQLGVLCIEFVIK